MPRTLGEKLRTPDSWVRELADALLDLVPRPAPLAVSLTYRAGLPDRLAGEGTSLSEVLADLRAGFVSQRRSGGSSDYYVLNGARFAVFVHTELETDALRDGLEVPLAVISKVQRQRGIPRRGHLIQASVTPHAPYDRAECDIADVH